MLTQPADCCLRNVRYECRSNRRAADTVSGGAAAMAGTVDEADLDCPILFVRYTASGQNAPVVVCEARHTVSRRAIQQVRLLAGLCSSVNVLHVLPTGRCAPPGK